jgi:hypothetical protein
MDNEAIVVVEMKVCPVTIPGISFVPVVAKAIYAIVQSFGIILTRELQQSGLNNTGE